MNGFAKGSIVLLLSITGASAFAQVHRCGDGKTYTDKPCAGAEEVDTRTNLLQAGPRFFPQYQPAPAMVVPDSSRPPPAASSGSAWDNKQNRDNAHIGRTYRP